MLEVNAGNFVNALRLMAVLETVVSADANKGFTGVKIDKSSWKSMWEPLAQLDEACLALGAAITQMAIADLRKRGAKMTYAEVAAEAKQIRKTFDRELTHSKLFALNPDDAHIYDTAIEMFGECTITSFPSIASEVDEAGKCLALGRSAAAIFHLMRIVEIGLRSLAPLMGIHEPKPDWGKVIRAVDEYLKLPKSERKLDLDDEYLANISAQMHAVKLAWRNQTMHVDTTFSLDNARQIFEQTKLLMIALSIELHEPS